MPASSAAEPSRWLWIWGARPRTLGLAVAPVLVGTSAAYAEAGEVIWWRALCALGVALSLQIGVNYANDYSDGVRGTDHVRAGPLRLTASGLVSPASVRRAAAMSFLVAAVAGLALAVAVEPWLLLVGGAAIAAAVLYTGGPWPYGYAGLGEAMVLIFFGIVGTAGSAFVQLESVPPTAWWGALVAGLPACAVLLTNNIRDVDTDRVAGKRTLAVRLGAGPARAAYVACIAGAFLAVVALALAAPSPAPLLAFLALPWTWAPARAVLAERDPRNLVGALVGTVRLGVLLGALASLGLCVS
jgi:1,4-dihydroxy-2-naphthoate octaprenyltransferase